MSDPNLEDQTAEAQGVPAPTPNVEPEGTDPLPVDAGATQAEPHDEEDVKAALERETQDGSGLAEGQQPPAEDFDGFPDDDVENDS